MLFLERIVMSHSVRISNEDYEILQVVKMTRALNDKGVFSIKELLHIAIDRKWSTNTYPYLAHLKKHGNRVNPIKTQTNSEK